VLCVVVVANDGYWGIPVTPNTKYHVSFYVRGDGLKNRRSKKIEGSPYTNQLQVSLESADGSKVFARSTTPAVNNHWQKFELDLTTGADVTPSTDNRFVISAGDSGRLGAPRQEILALDRGGPATDHVNSIDSAS